MIEKALRYIVGMKGAELNEIGDITYSDKTLTPVFSPKATPLCTNTLTSVVEYVKNGMDEINTIAPVILHVANYDTVNIISEFQDMSKERDFYLKAKASVPNFSFGDFYDTEGFNIALQSMFISNEDRDIILKVVGNLKDSAVRAIGDDGVSQSVTTKTGIATVADVKVPNPVGLRPYRTFLEIEQPLSQFVFRMRDGGRCALFEADGGAWKNAARTSIKEYLEFELSKEIEAKKIIILA